jgi:cytochrome P450
MVRYFLVFHRSSNYFWLNLEHRDFNKHALEIIFTAFLPKFIQPLLVGGIRSRESLVRVMDAYLHGEGLARGSPIVRAHFQAYKSYIHDSDIARFECGTALGTFANTTPTSTWTAFHIFSDAGLLRRLRAEISAITTSVKVADGTSTIDRIDARQLKSATILFSVIQEVARYRTTGLGIRYVTEDTIVGDEHDSYALKKNSW